MRVRESSWRPKSYEDTGSCLKGEFACQEEEIDKQILCCSLLQLLTDSWCKPHAAIILRLLRDLWIL